MFASACIFQTFDIQRLIFLLLIPFLKIVCFIALNRRYNRVILKMAIEAIKTTNNYDHDRWCPIKWSIKSWKLASEMICFYFTSSNRSLTLSNGTITRSWHSFFSFSFIDKFILQLRGILALLRVKILLKIEFSIFSQTWNFTHCVLDI